MLLTICNLIVGGKTSQGRWGEYKKKNTYGVLLFYFLYNLILTMMNCFTLSVSTILKNRIATFLLNSWKSLVLPAVLLGYKIKSKTRLRVWEARRIVWKGQPCFCFTTQSKLTQSAMGTWQRKTLLELLLYRCDAFEQISVRVCTIWCS